ncbi:hypothetical protein BBB39_15435 [Bordetella trematum]|uniref:DUF551 domain-containing protein n=1 Tax=Bordetella trematum TaxID=123899 RepID=A0A157PTU0_9BORD|nr:hypothetical protein [Bordetella trematum]AZR94999.1 hypothetical protein BBB39_15435 [Bordetella trematum]NNH18526.1 hypothetical protein [Bordetella trematum]SAI36983.1 Uncharacterised protein [Bordetella trematum]SAI66248.1 Uncharacterised protein [Bordetella trematum]SUV96693.1 Uncharacterised protein [Bordetella trematum]
MKQQIISLLERAKENGRTIGDVLAEVRGFSDGWQPIATAPKGGAEIWGFNGEQARMLWSEGEHWALWVWADSSLADIDPSPDQPTHWMPLPAAPGAEDSASRPAAPAAAERAPVDDLRSALAGLLDYVDRTTCTHEETHRGGVIWTICDDCGRKWADDEGGFVPHQDAPAVAAARAALASAPVAGEAQPVAWFIDWPDEPELGHYIAESPADSGRSRPLIFADASPQESTPVPEDPVYAYRRKGLGDFVTCDRERFDELSTKPRLFETRIFYAAPQASPAADGRDALPPLDENLTLILGRPNFACAQLAQMLRASGQTIKHRTEDEQAAVIYFLLSAYLKHGAGWADKASEALAAIAAQQGEGGA